MSETPTGETGEPKKKPTNGIEILNDNLEPEGVKSIESEEKSEAPVAEEGLLDKESKTTTPNQADQPYTYPSLARDFSREDVTSSSGELPSDVTARQKAEQKPWGKPIDKEEAEVVDAVPVSDEEYEKAFGNTKSTASTKKETSSNQEESKTETSSKSKNQGKQDQSKTSEYRNPFEPEAKAAAAAAAGAFVNEAANRMKGRSKNNTSEPGSKQPSGEDSKFRETVNYYNKREEEIRESIGQRPFKEIQDELASYARNPNPEKEKELKAERQKSLRVADEIDVIGRLKNHMLKIQGTLQFNEARTAIKRIDIESLENECTAFFGWDDKLKGILSEYRDVALLYMDLAELKARDLGNSNQAKHIEDQIRVRAWGTPPIGLERMAREYLESFLTEERKVGSDEEIKIYLKTLAENSQRQATYSERQVELLTKGYDEMAQHLYDNTGIDPRLYKNNLPPWFKDLPRETRDMFDLMLNINYLANRKAAKGTPDEVFGLKGELRLDSSNFQRMWRDLPGFKEAMTTMVSDLFDLNQNHFVLTQRGLQIMENEAAFKIYRDNLAERISTMISPTDIFLNQMHVGALSQSNAAVASAYHLLFVGGAFDSGDETGKLSLGSPSLVSAPFRFLYMPKLRGSQKWTQKSGLSEDFGGTIGQYIRWNIQNTPGYKSKFNRGGINFLPQRLLYSLFDHEKFKSIEDGGIPSLAEKSFAQVLLAIGRNSRTERGGVKNPTGININFSEIDSGGDMLSSYVENSVNNVLALYNHVTSGDPKNRLNRDQLASNLIKARKDKLTRQAALDEDFVMACIVMTASPNKGLVIGTSETVLDLPEQIYEIALYNTTNDPRIFEGMKWGSRNRILNRLHYTGIFAEIDRRRIIRKANKNIKRSTSFLKVASKAVGRRADMIKQGALKASKELIDSTRRRLRRR